MQLNKNDLHTMKYLTFYKCLSVFLMIFGVLRIISGLYDYFYKVLSRREIFFNNEIMSASLVVVAAGYLMLHFLKLIEKLNDCKK